MTVDVKWPRAAAWPAPRAFNRDGALAAMNAVTTVAEIVTYSYDSATKKSTPGQATVYTPAPAWDALITQPELGREEAWFYYTILWKRDAVSIVDAVAEPFPDEPLARVRHDLASRATPGWWDARAFWCCVAGMLSRPELAQLVGDARIFAHSYREGGTSILTGYVLCVSFHEAFYQLIAPRFGDAEWDIVQQALGAIGPALLDELKVDAYRISLVTARLRIAAASGRYDRELLAMLDAAAAADVPMFHALHAMRDPEHLAHHAPRLEERLLLDLVLEKWLDRFGASQPRWIIDSINAATTKKEAASLVATLARTLAVDELAPIMRAIATCKAGPDVARWLARHASGVAKAGTAKAAKAGTPGAAKAAKAGTSGAAKAAKAGTSGAAKAGTTKATRAGKAAAARR